MSQIVEKFNSMPDLFLSSGVSRENIKLAEKELLLNFSEEYEDYLTTFGVAAVNCHEFTGICSSKRLNVVGVTKEERINNPVVPANLYVIEQAHIDGNVIWQSETGEIYQSTPNSAPIKLCDSLCEYVEL